MAGIKPTGYTSSGFQLERGQMGRALPRPYAMRALCAVRFPLFELNAHVFRHSKTGKRLPSQTGFTLLEIVIAIAILAVVFTSLYSAFSSTLNVTELVETERDVEQAARLGLMQMSDDLASLYFQEVEGDSESSPYRFVSGNTETMDQGGTVVEFTTSGRLDFDMIFPSRRINRVSYVLETMPDNERYYRLVRREIPFAGVGGEARKAEIEIVDGVEKLTFSYVGEEGEALSQWDSEAQETEEFLPRLVRIRLQMAGDKSRFFTTTVALPPLSIKQEEG